MIKSDSNKEYAACVFLKWLTGTEQNLRFTAANGYIPVTVEAYDGFMAREITGIENENIRKLYETVNEMQKEYVFYVPPVFDGLGELQSQYARAMYKVAENSRREYLILLDNNQDSASAYEAVSRGVFEEFVKEN